MNHPNLVVVHYNPYAGGKFWINCLSHHTQAIPELHVATPSYYVDLWLLDDLNVDEIQRRKIARINSTLPDIEHMAKWCQYELGCIQFWGNKLVEILAGNHIVPDTSIQLLQKYRCFIVNHHTDIHTIHKVVDRFSNAKHIMLKNANSFQNVSMSRKETNPWPMNYITPDTDAFEVDVDNIYMDVDRTIHRVKECLEYLDLDTKLDPNIDSFVQRYFNLHQ